MRWLATPASAWLAGAALLAVAGCKPDATPASADGHDEAEQEAGASSRIVDIPPAVRNNLGITFVTVERRVVENTLRVPGRFELLPTARSEYRTMLPGRIRILVEQFATVEPGERLYAIDSPAWRELQQKISEAESAIARLQTKLETFEPLLAAHEQHHESLADSVAIWQQRIEQLQEVRQAGGGRIGELVSARSSLVSARAELASIVEKEAELAAARSETIADLDAARSRREFLLDSAASLLETNVDDLVETVQTDHGVHPRWRCVDRIEVRADAAGVVESLGLTNGAWADERTAVLTLVQPDRLRFQASGLQSDLGVLRDGLPARIVPPTPTKAGRAIDLQDTMEGTLALGLSGDPSERTIKLYVTPRRLSDWARPGVSAQLEIVTDTTASPVLAIPLAAVQRDGLEPIIFRRNPSNPNQAIRLEGDLGIDDGRWVAMLSGAGAGDEIVLDGAFQLMLATSGTVSKGGHFHPDGTFHEGHQRMLKALIRFSLSYSSLVIFAAVLLVAYAAYRVPRMSVDVFPELNAPTVVIMAEAGGLAADEVEQYVTFPIETAVNGLTGVRRVRSASAIGLSIVWVDLEWGADLYDARQLVAERLTNIRGTLPEEVEPFITPITSIAGEVMLISLASPDGRATPMELRSYAEFELRTRILAVPGVAQVVAIGGELPEYQVDVDQQRLQLYDLTISDVVAAAGGAHSTASAGYLPDVSNLEIPIRQQSRVTSPSDIARTIIKYHDGVPVTIGQVADVRLGPALKRGTAAEGGDPAVILSIQKSPGTNTLTLTDALDELFDQVEPALPAGMEMNRDVMRQAHFIDRAVDNVVHVLRDAAIIITIVLVLFLMNARTTIITLTALPISIAVGLLLMDWVDLGLNVMTLGGLAVAIGVLVDDAIIDVENVFRRLRQNRDRPEGMRRPFVEVIFDASNEIRPAMVFATVIIVMVFVPLLFLQGLEGRFFRPLGLTYMVSILASLVVALTVTPAMCRVLLRGRLGRRSGEGAEDHRDALLVRWLKRAYRPSLALALRLRLWVLGGAAAATVAALWLASTFGTSFLPSFNEGTFTVFLLAPPGTSLHESNRVAIGIERRLAEIEGVRSVSRRTGRAERDEHAEPVSNSEIEVTVEPGHERAAVREEIDRVLATVPSLTTMIGQPIEHRLSHVLSGTPAAIAINVFGESLPELRRVAKAIEAELGSVPGARDVNANREVMITSLPIRYRHAELAAAGLSPAAAAEQVREAIYGEVVDTVNQGVRQYDLVVRLAADQRRSLEQVRDLMLRGSGGAIVRLRDVADIGPERSSNLITRENAQRKAVISLNVAEGSNLGDLVAAVQERVDPIVRDAGLTVAYGGQFEAQQSAARTIAVSGLIVALVMLMLLQISTGSLRAALLVMLNMPLALIGGIAAVFLSESSHPLSNAAALFGLGQYEAPVLSIASLVGFITLFGIAVRNGILLINHYNHLMHVEGVALPDAIVQGSLERLVPILMTALAAALGLLPLALAAGEPGSELLAPLAIVTLGGLLTSTFLNLIVVPAGYSLVFGAGSRGPARAGAPDPSSGE